MSNGEPGNGVSQKNQTKGVGRSDLVTGGSGYIGSADVEQLVERDHEMVVYDNLIKGHRSASDPRAKFVEGELADRAMLLETLKSNRIDAVMHFAAHSLVGESMEHPGKYFDNNVSTGLVMVDSMLEAGVKLLVFSSTAATYGMPENIPIAENDTTAPINPYGESKLAFERMLRWFDEANGLKFVTLRYFNAAGASEKYGEMHDPETHIIP